MDKARLFKLIRDEAARIEQELKNDDASLVGLEAAKFHESEKKVVIRGEYQPKFPILEQIKSPPAPHFTSEGSKLDMNQMDQQAINHATKKQKSIHLHPKQPLETVGDKPDPSVSEAVLLSQYSVYDNSREADIKEAEARLIERLHLLHKKELSGIKQEDSNSNTLMKPDKERVSLDYLFSHLKSPSRALTSGPSTRNYVHRFNTLDRNVGKAQHVRNMGDVNDNLITNTSSLSGVGRFIVVGVGMIVMVSILSLLIPSVRLRIYKYRDLLLRSRNIRTGSKTINPGNVRTILPLSYSGGDETYQTIRRRNHGD